MFRYCCSNTYRWETTTKIYNYGIKTPFNSIVSWFSPSEEALAEIAKLKDENEKLKLKGLHRKGSISSIGSHIRRWRAGAAAGLAPNKPNGEKSSIEKPPNPWGKETPPQSPVEDRKTGKPLSDIHEESEQETPRNNMQPLPSTNDEEGGAFAELENLKVSMFKF